MGLYGDNTATKRPQNFRTPQNNHQMVSPGQQGGFEVTRAASKGGFHVIHDLGGGGGEGDGRLFFNISATFCRIWTIQLAASSLLATLTPDGQKYHLSFAQMRSNGVDLVQRRSLSAQQQGQKIHQCGRLSAFAAKRALID